MKTILAGLVFAIALAGCDAVEGMRDMKDVQAKMKALIAEQTGAEPFVGFTIDNDVLVDVTVSVNSKDVANRSVSELTRVVRAAVKQSFEEKPRVIYIQIATTAE